eukprot:366699_1
MITLNLIAIYIKLFLFTHSEYVTIWNENMETTNPDGWSGFHNFDFGYSSSNCPNSDKCAVVRANKGNSDIKKTTNISLYSALQLIFDLKAHSVEGNDACSVYYEYDRVSDSEGWILVYAQGIDNKYYNEIIDLPKPFLNNTNITIWLEIEGDADGTSGDTDKCYWNNVVLKGILYTTSPTLYPSLNPSINPSLIPTLNPTLTPTLNPSLNPTLNPSLNPTLNPTLNPSIPSSNPTMNPSLNPTLNPTLYPTLNPTLTPTLNPSLNPTLNPSLNPTLNPTLNPSIPSSNPTMNPSLNPTLNPTLYPTLNPTL